MAALVFFGGGVIPSEHMSKGVGCQNKTRHLYALENSLKNT